MKDYKLEDYESIKTFETDFIEEMNSDFRDLEVSSPKYTDCEILEILKVAEFNNKFDAVAEISCNQGIIQSYLGLAINMGTLTFPAEKQELLITYLKKLNEVEVAHRQKLQAEIDEMIKQSDAILEAQRLRKLALAKRAAELEAADKLYERTKRAQEKFKKVITTFVRVDQDPLDWLRENTVSITATIPSHLEKIFVSQFGDVPHKVVDSNRMTSGGHSMKFAESFSLTVKKDAIIPPALQSYFKGNRINNTSFIAGLIKKYDFTFGKTEA